MKSFLDDAVLVTRMKRQIIKNALLVIGHFCKLFRYFYRVCKGCRARQPPYIFIITRFLSLLTVWSYVANFTDTIKIRHSED